MDFTSFNAVCENGAARLLDGVSMMSLSIVGVPQPSPSKESSNTALIVGVVVGVIVVVAAGVGGFLLYRKFKGKNEQVANASEAGPKP
jgi:hypothetical protein